MLEYEIRCEDSEIPWGKYSNKDFAYSICDQLNDLYGPGYFAVRTVGGYERLNRWFGLDRASFAVVPRVFAHEMPDEWQDRFAALLEEYEDTFPNQDHLPNVSIRAIDNKGKLIPMPEWLTRYRRPDKEEIEKCRSFGTHTEKSKSKGNL